MDSNERSKSSAVPVNASERQRGVKLGPEHTRLPNQLIDLVYPWLSPSEQACLLYIVRRTYGFTAPGAVGTRKQWDRIALSQFVDGTSSGGYVLDLGTGLSRTSVIAALNGLEERGLIRVSYECPIVYSRQGNAKGCGWNQADEDHLERPTVDPKTNAPRCPRCKRTLSKAYALRALTPGWIKRFLNKNDPQKRTWELDPKVGRFTTMSETDRAAARELRAKKNLEASEEIAALRGQLFYPDLMDSIIGQAVGQLKGGKMSSGRMINGFLKPVIALQEKYPKRVVRYALEQTANKRVAGSNRNQNWHHYTKAIAENALARQHGGSAQAEAAQQAASVESELARCAELNRSGDREAARQVFHDLLAGHLDKVQEEFGGDRSLARRHLREAFKRGIDDYLYVRDYAVSVDYLPGWDWETDEQQG